MTEKPRFAPIVNGSMAGLRAVQSRLPAYGPAWSSRPCRVASIQGEKVMRKILLALSGAAIALTTAAAAAPVTGFTCTKWRDGVCVSTHRVRGAPAPYATGYVFGP